MSRFGKVHVYTGNSKGKTTTAFGIAMRAYGQNLKVAIIQFLKGGAYTGEFITIKTKLPEIDIFQYGKPCIKEKKQLQLTSFNDAEEAISKIKDINIIREDIECGECRWCFVADNEEKRLVELAKNHTTELLRSGNYDLVILDEVNNCLDKKLISIEEALDWINHKSPKTELILTGRDCPDEIIDRADLVTELMERKHYFADGTPARRGIEY
jgi:cob(I)alamin adenosyltransferase